MVSLAKKYEKKPFLLIASHAQNVPQETVVNFVKSQGVEANSPNFSLMSQTRHPDMKGGGIPHVAVFDHTGTKQYEGHPSGMDATIESLLNKVPAFYLGASAYTSEEIQSIAEEVKEHKSLGKNLDKLTMLMAEAEEEIVKNEAADLKSVLEDHMSKQRDNLVARLDEDPIAALDSLKELAKEFLGSAFGDATDEIYKEKKDDPVVKASILVGRKLASMRDEYSRLLDKDGKVPSTKQSSLESLIKKLNKLAEQNSDLPIADSIRAFITEIQ